MLITVIVGVILMVVGAWIATHQAPSTRSPNPLVLLGWLLAVIGFVLILVAVIPELSAQDADALRR
jgi:uncharacterized membrane protein